MNGIVLINKPGGITSHDVVARVRRRFNIKRVGHAGTLDPLATGLLIILVGESTKLFDKFSGFDKAYRSTLILGTMTDTADIQGKITKQMPYDYVTAEMILKIFQDFVGDIKQVPPMYSAVKMGGRKLYELARKGIVVERVARDVKVYQLVVEDVRSPEVKFYLECSKGTYVRQLAEDIGERLGCGACISQIQRTKIGSFDIKDSVLIEELNESHIRDWRG